MTDEFNFTPEPPPASSGPAPKDRLGDHTRRLAMDLGLTQHLDSRLAKIRAALEAMVRECADAARDQKSRPQSSHMRLWQAAHHCADGILRHWGLKE